MPEGKYKISSKVLPKTRGEMKGMLGVTSPLSSFFHTASALKIDQVAGIVQNTSNKPLLTVITFETSKNLVFPKA